MNEKQRLKEHFRQALVPVFIGMLAGVSLEILLEHIDTYLAISYLIIGQLSDLATTLRCMETGKMIELNPLLTKKPTRSDLINTAIFIDSAAIAISANVPAIGIGIGTAKLVVAGMNLIDLRKVNSEN